MLLFGHSFIESEKFYHILEIEAIAKTPPSSLIYLEFRKKNLDIIEYLKQNGISFALSVQNITELIYANALDANYIILSKTLAKTAQSIAESYLFDAKILVHLQEESEIEEFALLGIDGAIFDDGFVKISS